MKKTFSINRWLFLFLFVLYAVVSFFIFTFVFSGWVAIIYVLPLLLLVYGIILVSLLVSSIRKTLQGNRNIRINGLVIFMVLGLHILAIILGGGDCGDGSGIHSTLQLIFSPNSICRSNVDVSAYQLFSELGYVVFVSYLISILVFIYKTLSKSKDTVIL